MKQRVVKKEPWQKQKNIVFFMNIKKYQIYKYIYIQSYFQILNITPRSFPNINHQKKMQQYVTTLKKTQ